MAHSFWGIAEIVSAIAANLVSDKALASAVALASCCKSFEGPALGEVWRSLYSLAPLVSCFPPEAWDVNEKLLYFNRAPLCTEWARFQQRYASKVRHVKVFSQHEVDICWTALQLLQQVSDFSPILPNLVSLVWDGDDDSTPWISAFLSRSLTSITIMLADVSTLLPPVLRRLPTTSPYIREIRVQIDKAYWQDPSMLEASSQLLLQCNPNRLHKYDVDARISSSTLKHVMQLPSLESFWLLFDSSICRLPHPLPAVVFPSLQLLYVEHSVGDHKWLNLLPAIENPVLSNIFVRCPGPDVMQFMETFQLTVIGCGMHERLKLFDLRSPDDFKITPHIIACTFPLKNLTTLCVSGTCVSGSCQTSDLTDDDIELLTKALPYLEELKLAGKPCSIPSNITFKSLCTVSRQCTRLKVLQIHFNPTSFISTAADSGGVAQVLGLSSLQLSELCSVSTIHVGKTPWPDVSGASAAVLALGLVGVFPHLENIEYDDNNWEDINDIIKVFGRLGRFSFGRSGLLQGAH